MALRFLSPEETTKARVLTSVIVLAVAVCLVLTGYPLLADVLIITGFPIVHIDGFKLFVKEINGLLKGRMPEHASKTKNEEKR